MHARATVKPTCTVFQLRDGGPKGTLRVSGRVLRDGDLVIDTMPGDAVSKQAIAVALAGLTPPVRCNVSLPRPKPTPAPEPPQEPTAHVPPAKPKRRR